MALDPIIQKHMLERAIQAERRLSSLQFPHREPETRRLHLYPQDSGVLVEHTRDGNDYLRVCHRHQYCSVPTPFAPPACPHCLCEIENDRGRERYRALHAADVQIIGVL